MQAHSARPALCGLGSRVLRRRVPAAWATRGFRPSSSNLQDDDSNTHTPQRPSVIIRKVESSGHPTDNVQRNYNWSQSRRPATQPTIRRPPPDESGPSSGSEMRKSRPPPGAVDLRSLGSAGRDGNKPVLRPRSSFPANKDSRTPTGSRGSGARRPSGGNRRSGGPRRAGQRFTDDEVEGDSGATAGANKEKSREQLMVEKWDHEEIEEAAKQIDWTPGEETMESLRDYLPRMPVGEEGKAKMLTSRLLNTTDPLDIHPSTRILDQAARLRTGGYVYFRDEEEKAAVLEYARNYAEKQAVKHSERIGQEVQPRIPEFEPLGQSSRDALVQELYEGKYPDPVESTEHGELDKIVHLIRMNSTYTSVDEAAILKTLRERIQPPPAVPLKPAAKGRKKAKQAE